jgi:hypothetical protein
MWRICTQEKHSLLGLSGDFSSEGRILWEAFVISQLFSEQSAIFIFEIAS